MILTWSCFGRHLKLPSKVLRSTTIRSTTRPSILYLFVSFCLFQVLIIPLNLINSDLNPCIKDKYIKTAWDNQGQCDTQVTMEKIVSFYTTSSVSLLCLLYYILLLQFDRYETSHPAPVLQPKSTISGTVSQSSSWLQLITESCWKHEKDTVKKKRAELVKYLDEPLLLLNETLSSEEQGAFIFAWLKVRVFMD